MARVVPFTCVLSALVLCSVVAAQTRPTTEPAAVEVPEVKPFTLLLRIIDKETREPLSGVRVRYIASDAGGAFGDKGVADDVGLFVFALPTNKLRHLGTAIRLPGYIPMSTGWRGTIPADYTLEMERGTTIGGTVVDDAGRPVVGAKVTLSVRRDANQPNASFDIGADWVKSGEGGVWTYDRAPAGFTSADVSVADPRYVSGAGSSLVDVKPEEALARRLVLTLRPGRAVSGTVTDARGAPVEAAAIRVVGGTSDGANVDVQSGRDGTFRLTVEAASPPRLLVVKEGFAPECVDLATAKDADAVKVSLTSGRPFRVKVAGADGRPISQAWMIVTGWRGTPFTRSMRTDASGEAVWPNAPADEFEYVIAAEGYRPQQSLHASPSDDVQAVTLEPAK